MGKKFFLLLFLYFLILTLHALYSYSQIDLNLTLSANQYYQALQRSMINLGYFARPLSTFIYLLIQFFSYGLYFYILKAITKNIISASHLYIIIALIIFISLFAYPAYSHDIFNYIFDARIVTKYNLNPYLYKALDFPDDLWTRFMNWTHRTYPYGPIWLLITLPFSYLGVGKFVLTLFNFKLLFSAFYLGNIILISKLGQVFSKQNSALPVALFALNPLIITESLISPHNEAAMLFFLLLSLYLLFRKKFGLSIILLLLSAGVKFMTILLIPFYLIYQNSKLKISKNILMMSVNIMLVISILILIFYREAYPWYFIMLIGIVSLSASSNLKSMTILLSVGALLRYAPYLYYGEYSEKIKMLQWLVFFLPLTGYIIGYLSNKFIHKIFKLKV